MASTDVQHVAKNHEMKQQIFTGGPYKQVHQARRMKNINLGVCKCGYLILMVFIDRWSYCRRGCRFVL